MHPHLVREWHPTKNGALTPRDVLPGGKQKVWWRCRKDAAHEWEASIGARTGLGSSCPACAGRVATPTTCLRATHPGFAREWHPTKNGARTPENVKSRSKVLAWWRCQNDHAHVWRAAVCDRVRGRGCPECGYGSRGGRPPRPGRSLAEMYPELARQWHPTKSVDFTPATISARSGRKAWWRCALNPAHIWQAAVRNRANGTGCPACYQASRLKRALRGTEIAAPDPARRRRR
jgi:hypothetical protein